MESTKITEANIMAVATSRVYKYLLATLFLLMAGMAYCLPARAMQQQSHSALFTQNIKKNEYHAGVLKKVISVDLNNAPFERGLRIIAKKAGLKLVFSEDIIPAQKSVSLHKKNIKLEDALWALLAGTDLRFGISSHDHLVVMKSLEGDKKMEKQIRQLEAVSGTVTDATSGEALPSVNIKVKGTTTGTFTDDEGHYELSVPSLQDTLVFSFVGYQQKETPINGRTEINIALKTQALSGEELVVVGYGTQKKEKVTGSVSSIKSKDIESITTPDITTGLAGKLPGVRIKQNSSEPGSFDTSFDIRGYGNPLYIVDGMVMDKRDFARLNPNTIEDISVLKDASAAVYGVKAANGVVLVTTKKGNTGKPIVEYSGNYEIQNFTNTPTTMNAYQFAVYSDEVILNRGKDPGQMPYKPATVQAYKTGEQKGTDWYGLVQKDFSTAQTHNLNISGGNERIQYFTSLGFNDNQGMWKSGDLNYKKYNITANVTGQITDNLEANLKINGMKDGKNEPGASAYVPGSIGGVFFSLFMQDPTVPVYANNTKPYLSVTYDGQHPLAITNADIGGYTKTRSKTFQGDYTMTYQVPFVNGLSAKFRYGYYNLEGFQKIWNPKYLMYRYDSSNDTYINAATKNDPVNMTGNYSSLQRTDLLGQLSYENTFLNNHNIQAKLIFEDRDEKNDNLWAKSEFDANLDQFFAGTKNQLVNSSNIYENRNESIISKLSYDYSSKYLLEFGFNAGGSSLFPREKRWGFFPYFSGGWRISEEDFFQNIFPFITNLKFRGSWGQMGDDRAAAFQFLQGYTYPSGNYVFNDAIVPGLGFRDLSNPNITWTTVTTKNIGFDLEVNHGSFNLKLDLFERDRSGLLATRALSLPGTVGINLPQENLNTDMRRGFELVLGHSKSIGDFRYDISTNVTFTRGKTTHVERASDGNSYLNWRNNTIDRWDNIAWGYKIDGQFKSKEEILNSPVQHQLNRGNRNLLPGDIKYKDVNNDGIINNMDVVPIGKGNTPDVNFALNSSLNYEQFDINFLFQGATGFNYINGTWYDRGLLWLGRNGQSKFFNRWHRKDPLNPNSEWISGRFPSATINGERGNRADSEFWIKDATYLRLRSLDVGYTVPKKMLSKIGINKLRISLSGHNLITWTGLKDVDPERGSPLIYPITRTFNFGINLQF